ncbi:MAG: hypothetical protein ACO2O5_00805 [Candidatus Caldipriscus sp.]
MEFYLYTFKFSILKAKPPKRWLNRCRWMVLTDDGTPRFKTVLSFLESSNYPMIELPNEGKRRKYLIVKLMDIREYATLVVPDLLYDAILTPEPIKSIEDDLWDVAKYKFGAKGYALWKVGIESAGFMRVKDVKEKFISIYESIKKGVVNEGLQKP